MMGYSYGHRLKGVYLYGVYGNPVDLIAAIFMGIIAATKVELEILYGRDDDK